MTGNDLEQSRSTRLVGLALGGVHHSLSTVWAARIGEGLNPLTMR